MAPEMGFRYSESCIQILTKKKTHGSVEYREYHF